jgi:hypothetical protein
LISDYNYYESTFIHWPKVTVINVTSNFGKTRLDCLARGIPALYNFSTWEHKSMFGEHIRYLDGFDNGIDYNTLYIKILYSSISLFNYMVWDQETNILHELTFYSKNIFSHLYHRILTNSKDLLEYMIQSRFLSSCNRFKTFDFSTLYTTIPHSKRRTD